MRDDGRAGAKQVEASCVDLLLAPTRPEEEGLSRAEGVSQAEGSSQAAGLSQAEGGHVQILWVFFMVKWVGTGVSRS